MPRKIFSINYRKRNKLNVFTQKLQNSITKIYNMHVELNSCNRWDHDPKGITIIHCDYTVSNDA